MFSIPTDPGDKKKWINALETVRRKGKNDTFDPRKKPETTYVCEFHFNSKEIRVTAGYGRKKVIDNAPPSIFKTTENAENNKNINNWSL